MEQYEWMVGYTPQTEWIDKKGLFVWLAEVSTQLGSGLYLLALYFNSLLGMLIGMLIIVVLKCGFHLAHLSHPTRFWRMALKPRTSWLARGFIFLALFIVSGTMHLVFSHWLPGTAWEAVFKVVAGIMAILVAAYTGFVMNYINGIPFWNSAFLPLLFVSFSVLSGLALVLGIGLFGVDMHIVAATVVGIRLLLIVHALLLIIYLWSATYMGPTGKRSVKELIQGRVAPTFWLGVVLFGILIPLAIFILNSVKSGSSVSLLITGSSCVLIGVFSFNYCLLKAGLYGPLLPT